MHPYREQLKTVSSPFSQFLNSYRLYNCCVDKNLLNYAIILIGSFLVFYSVINMKVTSNEFGSKAYEISAIVFVAPIFVINSMFSILYADKIEEFRKRDKRLMFSMFVQTIRDKIDEGKRLTREWRNF